MEGFKKLSETNLTEAMGENSNVLIEDAGEIKRISADKIVSKGGGTQDIYYKSYYNSYLFKPNEDGSIPTTANTNNAATIDEFKNSFLTNGCLLGELNGSDSPYSSYSQVVYFSPYSANSATISFGGQSGIRYNTYYFKK